MTDNTMPEDDQNPGDNPYSGYPGTFFLSGDEASPLDGLLAPGDVPASASIWFSPDTKDAQTVKAIKVAPAWVGTMQSDGPVAQPGFVLKIDPEYNPLASGRDHVLVVLDDVTSLLYTTLSLILSEQSVTLVVEIITRLQENMTDNDQVPMMLQHIEDVIAKTGPGVTVTYEGISEGMLRVHTDPDEDPAPADTWR